MTHEPKDKQKDDPYAMQNYKAPYGNTAYHEWVEQQEQEQAERDESHERAVGSLVDEFYKRIEGGKE